MDNTRCLAVAGLTVWGMAAFAAIASAESGQHRTVCLLDSDRRIVEILPAGAGCELAYSKLGKTTVAARAQKGEAHCEAARQRVVASLERAGFECTSRCAAVPGLHQAAERGDLKGLERELSQGSDIHAKDSLGHTALERAAFEGQAESVRWLLDHGADIEMPDGNGLTPLHSAAWGGFVDAARVLIERGAKLDARNALGQTPLFFAAFGGHEAFVRLLLDLGADPTVKDYAGMMAEQAAQGRRYAKVARLLAERTSGSGAAPAQVGPVGVLPAKGGYTPGVSDKLNLSWLGTLRAGASIFYGDHEGVFPRALQELIPKYFGGPIPTLRVPEHAPSAEVLAYDRTACSDSGMLDRSKLKDTGKWGYVGDAQASCAGTIFIDCVHTDAKGTVWADY